MEIAQLLKTTVITGIELHASCLALAALLYMNMRGSFIRNARKYEHSLGLVYICSALMLITDCIWASVSTLGKPGSTAAYLINLLYFLSSSTASAGWFFFCRKQFSSGSRGSFLTRVLVWVPYAAVILMYLLSPWFGFIFSIEDGAYVRGSLFFLDPVIKMGYIVAASVLAFCSGRKKEQEYLRKQDYNFVLFGVPVLACGILQTVTGADFICIGVTFGLILIYVTGITNRDSENTDAIYSLANSFEASYIVNMDTGAIRPLRRDVMHDKEMPGMDSMDYSTHFSSVLSEILLPEDRTGTLEAFALQSVAKRFTIDNSFTVRYRVREQSGLTALHTASFIHAAGNQGKQEFLLGINTLRSDSLLYERNESLNHENRRLEQINASIIESVAKIVEARDGGSGAHIIRVRKVTELLAAEVMAEYPEYGLDEGQIKLISFASVLHDVGKIVIPDAILLKPGRLADDEFRIMKTHTSRGCDILNNFPLGLDDAFLECALSICRWHHEKYDGRGYPDGLKGDDIPIAAQIVSVADCFDALVSDRPYKKAFTPEVAFEMIKNGECGAFSGKILHVMEKQKSRLTELARLYR